MHQRNAIEGTLSELARGHGLRRSRYRGFAKVELQNLLIGTACNVKRWLRAILREAKEAQTRGFGFNLALRKVRCLLLGLNPLFHPRFGWRPLTLASSQSFAANLPVFQRNQVLRSCVKTPSCCHFAESSTLDPEAFRNNGFLRERNFYARS